MFMNDFVLMIIKFHNQHTLYGYIANTAMLPCGGLAYIFDLNVTLISLTVQVSDHVTLKSSINAVHA